VQKLTNGDIGRITGYRWITRRSRSLQVDVWQNAQFGVQKHLASPAEGYLAPLKRIIESNMETGLHPALLPVNFFVTSIICALDGRGVADQTTASQNVWESTP
jgi:hypothetical protein